MDADDNAAADRLDALPAAANDRDAELATDVFRHLYERSCFLDDLYPFLVTEDDAGTRSLELRDATVEAPDDTPEVLTHKLYLVLLCASCLPYFSGTSKQRISTQFELVSYWALRAYLPSVAEVHIFGAAGGAKGTRFLGPLSDKVEALASALKLRPNWDYVATLNERNSGDGGIDLCGWIDLPGDDPGQLIEFGQAAATLTWPDKLPSSGWHRVNHYFEKMQVPSVNACFIPFSWRDATGRLLQSESFGDAILFDRLRILGLLAAADRQNLDGAVMSIQEPEVACG